MRIRFKNYKAAKKFFETCMFDMSKGYECPNFTKIEMNFDLSCQAIVETTTNDRNELFIFLQHKKIDIFSVSQY